MTNPLSLARPARLHRPFAAAAVVVLLCAFAAPALSAALEVIPLKYRTADQLIPVLKPLLDPQGSISGMQNQLIIRTTPRNLAELKRVLASLDTMPRRLMITVTQAAAASRDQDALEASARISTGGATVVIPGSGAGGAGGRARRGDEVISGRVQSTRSLDSDRNTQTVQVLEGRSAYIRVGQSVALPQRRIVRSLVDGRLVERIVDTAIEYRDVLSGFHAVARLAGEQVIVEISPQRESLSGPEQNLPEGSVNVQRAVTTVSGRLGEWIEVGAVVQGEAAQQSAILGSTRDTSSENRRILIKVDEIR